MVYFYFHQSQLKMQISVLDTQYDLIESQYVRAQNFYTENAKLYHDIKHHLRALERLLQNAARISSKSFPLILIVWKLNASNFLSIG